MDSKPLRITCALLGCYLGFALVVVFNVCDMNADLAKCLVDKDEEPHWFSVQTFMWIVFGWGVGELVYRYIITKRMHRELELHLLPDDDPTLLLPKSEIPGIHKRLKEAGAKGVLAKMITLLAYQFQSAKSISACHECLTTQSDINANRCTMNYGTVRYITWLIPSLGFIGTVLGILLALREAKGCTDIASALPDVINGLSVAFWTTLLALIMCCMLMLLQHLVQSREEDFHATCSEYCLLNFINRLVVTDRDE